MGQGNIRRRIYQHRKSRRIAPRGALVPSGGIAKGCTISLLICGQPSARLELSGPLTFERVFRLLSAVPLVHQSRGGAGAGPTHHRPVGVGLRRGRACGPDIRAVRGVPP